MGLAASFCLPVLSASRLTSSLPIAARAVAASPSRPWWWSGCWLWIGPRAGRRVFGHNWLALGVFCYRDPQQRSAGPGTVGNLKSADGGPLGKASLTRVHRDVDWIGALLISACLAFLYELAVATGSDADQSMRQPLYIVLLRSALALIPVFALWMRRQVRFSRPALIPNSLWTKPLQLFVLLCSLSGEPSMRVSSSQSCISKTSGVHRL